MPFTKLKFPLAASITVLFGFILLSLQLMSSATQASSELNAMYSWLLLSNAVGTLILFVLVGINAYSLVRELRKKEAGSKLTTRMVSLFVLIALAPAAIVFFFSVQFLRQGIDSWFNVEIDRAMDDALELSQSSLNQRLRWHIKQTRQIAERLNQQSERELALSVGLLWDEADMQEMAVFSNQGLVIASRSVNPSEILPHLPDEQIWLQLKQNREYFAFDSGDHDEMLVRVIVAIGRSAQPQFLQVLYSVPVRVTDLTDSIEFAFVRYQEMTFLRSSLKTSFSLILLLVLLLSLLAAIWVAFISIRQIVAPVKELVKGTQAVADGNYAQQLPVMMQDDLGFLVESFNQMTQRIAQTSEESRAASIEIDNQRAYLETILANLSAGVMSFDAQSLIRTVNQAACRILHIPAERFVGQTLAAVAENYREQGEVLRAIHELSGKAEAIWEQRIVFLGANGRQELLCRGTPLFAQEGRMGAVVVFDDVTDLIQAQKNAAWGEVARRLAHEIKNPLTPIQLSAERLQHKLSKELQDSSAEMLQRSTRTIVQQVEAMKRMVDDFAEYARPSKKQVERINLIDLIQEVLALYSIQAGMRFATLFFSREVWVEVDPVSIRQVLHNLIKNALEAMTAPGEILIRVDLAVRNNARYVELAVYDQGVGISAEQIEHIFEPYVTTKTKGTGLGLAIVKKIVEEHGGVIWVDTNYTQGAGFVLQLPVVEM